MTDFGFELIGDFRSVKKGNHLSRQGEVCRCRIRLSRPLAKVLFINLLDRHLAHPSYFCKRSSLFFKRIVPKYFQTYKVKTFMNKKNLIIQTNDSVNSITDQDLSAEIVELSDEALSQVCGGGAKPQPKPQPKPLVFPPGFPRGGAPSGRVSSTRR